MYYHWRLCKAGNDEDLLTFLEENKIKHIVDKSTRIWGVIMDVYSTRPDYQQLLEQLEERFHASKFSPQVEYTAKDRDAAEYLWIRSKKLCIEVANADEAYEYSCYHTPPGHQAPRPNHETQVSMLRVCNVPKPTTQTAFCTTDFDDGYLFADHRIKALAEAHQLKGIEFHPVRRWNGQISEDFFQVLGTPFVSVSAMARGYGEEFTTCPVCGKEMMHVTGCYQMHLNRSQLDTSLDFLYTEPVCGPLHPFSCQLISQRFYRLLKQEKLAGGLFFNPVVLHD